MSNGLTLWLLLSNYHSNRCSATDSEVFMVSLSLHILSWQRGRYQGMDVCEYGAEPRWALVVVAWRRTQLFHHHCPHNYTQAGISVCLPACYPHRFIVFSFPLPPLALLLLSSSLSIRRTLPGSSPGLQHRRRLASQWSNFTAVDADVKRSIGTCYFCCYPISLGPTKRY